MLLFHFSHLQKFNFRDWRPTNCVVVVATVVVVAFAVAVAVDVTVVIVVVASVSLIRVMDKAQSDLQQMGSIQFNRPTLLKCN